MKTSISTFSRLFTFLLFLTFSTNSFAQKPKFESPYKVTWKGDGAILGGALAAYGIGLAKIVSLEKPSEASVLALDKNDLKLKINRNITDNTSKAADHASDVFLFASYGAAGVMFGTSDKLRQTFVPAFVVFAEGYLYVRATTFLLKSTVLRFRPFAYNQSLPLDERQTDGARTSFISGHTSTSTYIYFATAKIFADHYPNAKARPYIWAGATTLSLLTGYYRMEAGKHFVGDVAGGFAVGALFGILVPHFHKKAKEKSINQGKKTSFRIYPADNGMLLSFKF